MTKTEKEKLNEMLEILKAQDKELQKIFAEREKIAEQAQMMNREEMMNNVMRKFGLEAEQTLAFCDIAETWKSDKAVACMYAIAMGMGVDDYE